MGRTLQGGWQTRARLWQTNSVVLQTLRSLITGRRAVPGRWRSWTTGALPLCTLPRNLPGTRTPGGFCVVFKLMFVTPRMAPNTANPIRTAPATGAELHLVEPMGFDLSEPKLRRAGLDYHDLASVTVHASLQAAWDALLPARVVAFTAHATTSFADVDYQAGDVLMFGPEPDGLDAATLADAHITRQVPLPMLAGRRSLNLAHAASVAVSEARRQQAYTGAV